MPAVVANTIFGPFVVPPYDEYLSQALIRMGQYAPEEFATWRPYLPAGGIVLEVGANIGPHTIPFAMAVGIEGRVIACEPQRMLAYMLCGTVALIDARNVEVKNVACGRESGVVHIPPIDYGSHGNFGGLELKGRKEGEPIPCIPVDAMQLPRVDFLKIDVEGMELDVLHGAKETLARCRPVISVEADREAQVPALLGFLKTHDYRAWWHRPPLGPLWPRIVSINLLALPRGAELPEPQGHVEPAIP